MVYQKEVSERSPLRVFERSTNGGLGRGNVGVVMSRAGVGKTAFLVGVALDDLMRDRKVLHINTEDPLDKVRAFYDEVFHDLAESTKLENRAGVHLEVERNRIIHTYTNGAFSMDKMRAAIDMARELMHFEPYCMVVDGYPQFRHNTEDEIRAFKDLAVELNCEMWLNCRTQRDDECDERGVPNFLARFEEYLSVMVRLDPAADHVKLELLKDHDNSHVSNLFIELDPRTLLLKWR